MNKANSRTKRSTGASLSMKDLAGYLKREHRSYGLCEEKKPAISITAAEVLNGVTWDHEDFSGRVENSAGMPEGYTATLYMVLAGDDQTPCRWNGRQLTVEWIDDNGVPLFTREQATYLINCTYKFFESVGRTAMPILRPVPVFQIQTI